MREILNETSELRLSDHRSSQVSDAIFSQLQQNTILHVRAATTRNRPNDKI